MATVDSLSNELAIEAGEDYSDAGTANQFQKWVIEAYTRVISSSRFLWQNSVYTLNTSAAVAEYTLDPAVAEITVIRNTSDNTKVGYNTVEDLTTLRIDLEENAAPKYWFYSGIDISNTANKITLVPIPDGAYSLEVRALNRPNVLTSSTLIPLPDEFVELIRVYVRAMWYYHQDRTQEYIATLQDFNNTLQLYITRYSQPRQSKSMMRGKNLPRIPQAPAASQD